MPRALLAFFAFFTLVVFARADTAAWGQVPAADFSKIRLEDFADHELEVPEYLSHFAQVANAVAERGEHRGYLDLAVNRDPKDNRPYNARIMEMQMALAYFYGVDRPWNPYRGHPAVRVRLEAMLDRWTRIQNPDGLFAEYSPNNYSLAPTNFGAMAAAQAVEILRETKAPFDEALLRRVEDALRAALFAMFTREDMRRHARDWSNQFSGSYYAALISLRHAPDARLDFDFVAAVVHASAEDQSPAGYHYEQGGPDFGYSGVHENNLRVAWPLLRARADLSRPLLAAEARWNRWLAHNHVVQPVTDGRLVYLINAGVNTRTSHALQTPRSLPLAELVAEARAFATTTDERRRELAARREALARSWGDFGKLAVPSPYSYRPGFVYGAWRQLDDYTVTSAERAKAVAALPCLAPGRFNRQLHDALPFTVTLVRRPAYYAAFNSGRIRVPRQNYGLGLLWNEKFGAALQAVAGTPWAAGVRTEGADKLHEQSSFTARTSVGGAIIAPKPGEQTLREGDLRVVYPLGDRGDKTVVFSDARVTTEITHRGAFAEQLPLIVPSDAKIETSTGRVRVQRADGASFVIETATPGARISLGEPERFAEGLNRRRMEIASEGSLRYELSFR